MKEEKRIILRGDIYYADLSPVVGCEQGGVRPILVLQNNIGNKYSQTVIVGLITSKDKRNLPTHVPFTSKNGLRYDSVLMLEQIRTIDKQRLIRYIGTATQSELKEIDSAILISLGVNSGEDEHHE